MDPNTNHSMRRTDCPSQSGVNILKCRETAVDIARRQIDLQLAHHAEAMRALRSRRNELAPISHLHPEILGQIFCIFASIYAEASNPSHSSRLSFISRQWCAVALQTSEMWSHISTKTPHMAEMMLARSNPYPVIVDSEWGLHIDIPLQQFHRIKELYLSESQWDTSQIIEVFTEGHAPYLEICHLRNNRRSSSPTRIPISAAAVPRLKELLLVPFSLNWSAPLPQSLTFLEIDCRIKHTRATLTEFLRALQCAQRLVHLSLSKCLPNVRPGNHCNGSTVNFADLKTFDLVGLVSECAQILEHIHFPASAALSLEISGVITSWAHCLTLANRLGDHLSRTSLQELQLTSRIEWGWLPTSTVICISETSKLPLFTLAIRQCREGPTNNENLRGLMAPITSRLCLETLKILLLSTGPGQIMEAGTISEMFQLERLRDVHTLRIHGTLPEQLLRGVSMEYPEIKSANNSAGQLMIANTDRVFMPSLQHIVLTEISSQALRNIALLKVLKRREQSGHAISSLTLRHCGVEREEVDRLAKFVEKLHCENPVR